jgi:hypothetical protein
VAAAPNRCSGARNPTSWVADRLSSKQVVSGRNVAVHLQDMTLIGLAGDWHGNRAWAAGRIMSVGDRGIHTLLHVGDFGIWPGSSGARYLEGIEATCRRYRVTVYVTAGNHEDWPRLLASPREERDDFGELIWLTDHVAVFPRDPSGHRFHIDGRSFLSLGGAPSLDFEWRIPGETWWSEEMLPRETVARVVADGPADVMITHDAPDHPWQTPAVAQICATNPFGWSNMALAYAAAGRNRLTQAFLGVRPRLLVHGHYHVADEATVDAPGCEGRCRVVSLSRDGFAGNTAVLDTETLAVSIDR